MAARVAFYPPSCYVYCCIYGAFAAACVTQRTREKNEVDGGKQEREREKRGGGGGGKGERCAYTRVRLHCRLVVRKYDGGVPR